MYSEEQWVIWNGNYGIVDTVYIKRIEENIDSRSAWLDEPYDMVGPIDFNELQNNGLVNFAACTIMSSQEWSKNQVHLRRMSAIKRRKAQEKLFEDIQQHNFKKQQFSQNCNTLSEKESRNILNLPLDTELDLQQIKKAFRTLAKSSHPDTGGDHEQFINITNARDFLIKIYQ